MRVVRVQSAGDPITCGNGPVHIGSAPDDDIILDGAGIAVHHVSIVADTRGLVMVVAAGSPRVYVNARAVRERALLRHGDTLTLGAVKLLLTTDNAPREAEGPLVGAGDMAEPVALRVVSGVDSGRVLPVQPELRMGAGSRHFGELGFACRVAQTAAGLVFESDNAKPRVNGWRCQRALLTCNDQISLGEHRLVVEAPGLQYASRLAEFPPPPAPAAVEAEAPPEGVPHDGIWWLIAAAAVLAAIIALILYFHG